MKLYVVAKIGGYLKNGVAILEKRCRKVGENAY